MTTPAARSRDVMALVRHVSDPLAAAVSIAAAQPEADDRRAIVKSAAETFTQRLNTRTLLALARYAKRFAAQDRDAMMAQQLTATDTMAGRWLGAAMLETLGAHEEAAAALDRMEDASWGEERALRLAALSRNLQRAGRVADAWLPLRHAAAAATTKQALAAIRQLILEGERHGPAPARARRRVAVLGTGTLTLWTEALETSLFGADIRADVLAGEFGQFQQEILGPASPLATFRPEVVVLAVDHRALGIADLSPEPDQVIDAAVDRFQQLWRTCQERFGAAVVQFTFEVPEVDPFGGLSALLPGGRARIIQQINLRMTDAARASNVAVFDMNEAASVFGKERWNDSALWVAARQYPSADAVPVLTRRLSSVIRAACGLTSKCVVLDLDNTLWGGIIGEDGLNGIRLGGDAEGEAYVAFHRYLLGLRQRGIPLAVCSKNNETDALSVFREHPESVLRESDFAVFLANWEPKPDNLRRVAAMLNIGLDSLVFIDDNAMERNFIRTELPEVAVPEFPEDPAHYVEALHRSLLFESVTFTDEDRHRAESYRQNAQRATVAAASTDIDGYLASLAMKVELRPFDALNLPRIVQLVNKTNQFNLTTRRTTAAEAERWMRDPSCYTQCMRLTDRFGDSGLTGVLVAFHEGDCVRIDTWLMSCRVLGRRIEDAMLASVGAYARAVGARAIVGEYIATAKNAQVRSLFPRFGFQPLQDTPERVLYELAAAAAPRAPAGLFEIHDATVEATVAAGEPIR